RENCLALSYGSRIRKAGARAHDRRPGLWRVREAIRRVYAPDRSQRAPGLHRLVLAQYLQLLCLCIRASGSAAIPAALRALPRLGVAEIAVRFHSSVER